MKRTNSRAWLLLLLLWPLAGAVMLVGCKRQEIIDQSIDAKVERLEKRVQQLEQHECGGAQ